jgi:diaminopimelate decarboxylase
VGQSVLNGFTREGGVLVCRGVSLERIAADFGTPLYVYDVEGIEAHVRRFQEAFRAVPFLLAYAVKANGALALLNRIAGQGAGADIVSLGELRRATRAGVPPDRIVFAGVGKTAEEMEAGLEAGIFAFHVESVGELDLLAEVAGRRGMAAPVSLRVNPDVESPTPHAYTRTGHAASKFGIPLGEAEALYISRRGDARLSFRGIAVHIGSQIADLAPYLRALDMVIGLVDRLAEEGIPLEYLDLGGGFGVGYDGEPSFDLDALAQEVVTRIEPRGLRLILEPGRAIVGEAGILLTRVLYVKRSGGKTFIVIDGGMTELLRPSHYGGFHRIVPVREREGAAEVVADIVGPICETGDFLALDRPIALPEPGDLLAVETSGAYGFAMASNYNARRRPAEVMVEAGGAILIRRRESFDDLVRGEEIPARRGETQVPSPTAKR